MFDVLLILFFVTSAQTSLECGLKNFNHNKSISYRSIDGLYNNKNNPNWGTKFSVYDRMVPAKYGNNNSIANCVNGKPLPNARYLSTVIFSDKTHPDPKYSVSALAYGQVVAHDLSYTYLTKLLSCNENLGKYDHDREGCANINIPDDDFQYSQVNTSFISLLRTQTNLNLECSLDLPYTAQISEVTAFLDLSIIYGSINDVCNSLRTYQGGMLKSDKRNQLEWLPNCENNRTLFCPLVSDDERCYILGDSRVNQNPHLTIFHIIWTREHNRIANELSQINPHWSDEKIFQVTRAIAIAEHQHITYYELLPCYGGKDILKARRILYDTDDFVNDYNDNMRPHVFNEFAQGAFRHFHSLVPGVLSLVESSGCPYRSVILRDHINRPQILEEDNNFDSLIRGMVTQASLKPDAYTDPEMTNFLFLMHYKVGLDVKAIDIQRARDHGLGSYNDMREYCGLGKVEHFHQLLNVMDQTAVDKLILLYDDPNDIDLVVGGSLEIAVPGLLLGPTFLCIVNEQFYKTRTADRFFFESPNSGFTRDQLLEIKKSTVSKLLCDNGNDIYDIQKKGFLQVSESNHKVPCQTIPGPDLKLWVNKM